MPERVDPVCGMELEPGKVVAQTVYQGTEYDFCSEECKRIFEENPEAYIGHGDATQEEEPPPIPL